MSNYLFPISYAQKRVWNLDKFMSQNFGFAIFNIPYIIEVAGDLNVEILNKSINFLIARHLSLRTGILEKDGELFQKVFDKVEYKLEVKKPCNEQKFSKKEIQCILEQEINHTFNLNQAPLFRATLIELDNDKYILVFLLHHIISDEWSVGIFSQELSRIYTNYLQGHLPGLIKLESSYGQFSTWQKAWFEGEKLDQQLNFWKSKLDNHKLFHIPFDHENNEVVSESGSYRFSLNEEITRKLKELSAGVSSTLFITLLAIYKVALHKIYNQNDILVVSPISSRHYDGVENLIGCFVNYIILRSKIEEECSFLALLNDIKISALEAYDNQDIPFDMLMDNVSEEEGYQKYFPQLFFEMKKAKKYSLDFPGTTTKWCNNLDIESLLNNDLRNNDDEKSSEEISDCNALDIEIEYSAALYNESTFARLADNFMFITKQIIDNPQIIISQISLLQKGTENGIEKVTEKSAKKDPERGSISRSEGVCIPSLPRKRQPNSGIIEKLNKYLKFSVKEL